MIGLNQQPEINVLQTEYQRLLGVPATLELSGLMKERSDAARAWFAEHGRSWVYTREATELRMEDEKIWVDTVDLRSPELYKRLEKAEAHSVVVAAVSAGPEVVAEAQRLWEDGRPDEYFFLIVYASAVVEHLTTMTGARLCAWADQQGMAVLPHYSPGYPGWDLSDQAPLWSLIQKDAGSNLPVELEVMGSGMLRPGKSQLSAFGITRRTDLVKNLVGLIPCEGCPLHGCQYRRAPYQMPAEMAESTKVVRQAFDTVDDLTTAPVLTPDATYAMNPKALETWRKNRLKLDHRPDGKIIAQFHTEGSTCSDMGWPLAFDHTITLAPRDQGYQILATSCTPDEKIPGYRKMCSYIQKQGQQLAIIDEEKPLIGLPLDSVLSWEPTISPDGCYCSRAGRNHKWRNVLQTLHYAMVHYEKNTPANTY
jgi:hypothetical protein